MNKGLLTATAIILMTDSAYAQMSGGQGGGMMVGNWGWGMGYGGVFGITIVILAIVVIVVYVMRRK